MSDIYVTVPVASKQEADWGCNGDIRPDGSYPMNYFKDFRVGPSGDIFEFDNVAERWSRVWCEEWSTENPQWCTITESQRQVILAEVAKKMPANA